MLGLSYILFFPAPCQGLLAALGALIIYHFALKESFGCEELFEVVLQLAFLHCSEINPFL